MLFFLSFFLSLFRLSSQPTDQEGLANQVRSYLWKKTLVSLLYGFSVAASIYPLDPYSHRGFSLNPLRIRGFCPVLVVEQRFGDFGREKKVMLSTSKTVLLFLVQYCYSFVLVVVCGWMRVRVTCFTYVGSKID